MTTGSEATLRVAIVVASLGRPDGLSVLLAGLARQSISPAAIVLSVTSQSDVPANKPGNVTVVMGSPGLPAQRNRGLEAVIGGCDVVAFFDDDYVPSRGVVEGLAAFFAANPDVAGANGLLLADGVRKGGLSYADAQILVDAYDEAPHPAVQVSPLPNGLYGCNMAYRAGAIGALRFDEALPLYAWQEDIDFSRLVAKNGRLVKTNAFVGVHCGVTKARSSGVRLGYSQIANPTYLIRKGTIDPAFALELMARNFIANHVRSLSPEPWVDRAGRLKGNWLALRDLAAGRLRPDRILSL